MKNFTVKTTLMGKVTDVSPEKSTFAIKCRSGDEFIINTGQNTQFQFLRNLDGINRDRVPTPEDFHQSSPADLVRKYIQPDSLVVLQGVYQENNGSRHYDARTVNLLHSYKGQGEYLFEQTHWWITQIGRLADGWLGYLFPNKQSYKIDDFALYRTNLNIIGLPTDDNDDLQECATLSRVIYGLSSTYLITGGEQYLSAARAGVQYQRENFRSLTSDGKHCFWAFGKRKTEYSYELYMRSLNDDDRDTIPLYEQIYALVGLAQYYRITLDWEVLDDIKRTVRMFNEFFTDPESEYGKHAYGDYFSHLDYVTFNWNSPALGENYARKNWNSIGDHIPAYLINLILALEPLPLNDHGREEIRKFLEICKKILKTSSTIIADKFPDPDPNVPFVNERFFRDWKPDHNWRWQQNRAVVGHNLKIAWNLTRVANYYYSLAAQSAAENPQEAEESQRLADKLMKLADRLGIRMAEIGVDLFRGGIFDTLERNPQNGTPLEFPWLNTKDFWQQEQALLAYLILHGCSNEDHDQKQEYLRLARETAAFWNLFFLDQENKGVFFRVSENGDPVTQGQYGQKESHSSGYHHFELNYLAHIYISSYVTKEPFCLYFKPDPDCRQRSLNILPDFFRPNTLEVSRISINGSDRTSIDPDNFQLELGEKEFQLASAAEIIVEFAPKT
ncbi:N-acyl-D-glucosamine 2-epimerase [Nostoc sp. CENA67]|uniref:N-acyl-D-glucosamine 2-epimerase n=1 Tax=Amazonocrinis nigriterrae CENA67 TaxID=2794033 RepID=A0A8J7HW53_9NOST|nr:N-acyl-D-glucosamine 2-epimerase [Amazonocrinis nigriterrae]MBH8566981.1 N-acyl-D-glucosamine 2-epimerase [Amazonocrinis nigriterrae CENA67]